MYFRKQRESVACMAPSPKDIPHKQLVQLKKGQVNQSSIEQPSTHIIMYVCIFILTMPIQDALTTLAISPASSRPPEILEYNIMIT